MQRHLVRVNGEGEGEGLGSGSGLVWKEPGLTLTLPRSVEAP